MRRVPASKRKQYLVLRVGYYIFFWRKCRVKWGKTGFKGPRFQGENLSFRPQREIFRYAACDQLASSLRPAALRDDKIFSLDPLCLPIIRINWGLTPIYF